MAEHDDGLVRLRRSSLHRPDFADRPNRDLEALRVEKWQIEAALLALVAEDPRKVAVMNRLLDALSLNSSDHTRRRLDRLGQRVDALTAQVADRTVQAQGWAWVQTKTPENAVKKAVGRIRALMQSAATSSPPGGKVIDRAVGDLYTACARLVDERVAARDVAGACPGSKTGAP